MAGRDPEGDVTTSPLVRRPVGRQDRLLALVRERLAKGTSGLEIAEVADDVPIVVGGVADLQLIEPVGVQLAPASEPRLLRR